MTLQTAIQRTPLVLARYPIILRFWQNRPLVHIAFWVAYVVFYATLWASFDDDYRKHFVIEFIALPVKVAFVYVHLYVLMPIALNHKRYLNYIMLLLISMIVAGLLQRAVDYYVIYPIYYPDAYANWPYFLPAKIIKGMLYINTVVVFTAGIKLLQVWYRQQKDTQTLEKERLAAELKFLKAQIHPHFLFNTLNNLYALTLKKSDHAPEVVLKLSELMSYMLYDANTARVPVAKEVNYIENYIALERLRFAGKLEIALHANGDLASQHIAPMLLLPFIENSFKHGVSEEIEDAWITIDLAVKNNFLTLKVENSVPAAKKEKSDKAYAKGIGLQNVNRRLEVLYQEHYDLKVFQEEGTYLVVLRLNLAGYNQNVLT